MRQLVIDMLTPLQPYMPYTGAVGGLLLVVGLAGITRHRYLSRKKV